MPIYVRGGSGRVWGHHLYAFAASVNCGLHSHGNQEIGHSLRTMYQNEPQVRERCGIDLDLQAYVGRMLAAHAD